MEEDIKKLVEMFEHNPKKCVINHIEETIKHIREIEMVLKLSGIITLIIDSKITKLDKIKEILINEK